MIPFLEVPILTKLVLTTAVCAAALVGLAGTASAYEPPPLVGVHVGPDGSVCFGISYQTPTCTPPLG